MNLIVHQVREGILVNMGPDSVTLGVERFSGISIMFNMCPLRLASMMWHSYDYDVSS